MGEIVKEALLGMVTPGGSLKAVTPNDDVDLPAGAAKALLVVADGNLEVIAERDETGPAAFAVTAGFYLAVRVRRVTAGTTATVLAIY